MFLELLLFMARLIYLCISYTYRYTNFKCIYYTCSARERLYYYIAVYHRYACWRAHIHITCVLVRSAFYCVARAQCISLCIYLLLLFLSSIYCHILYLYFYKIKTRVFIELILLSLWLYYLKVLMHLMISIVIENE